MEYENNTVLEALHWRYGVKKFSEQTIDEQRIKTLLEATRLSASSYGLQPYNIIIIKSSEIRKKLVDLSYGQDKVVNSSHLIVLAVQTNIGDETVDRYINKYCEVTGTHKNDLKGYADHMKSALAAKDPFQRSQWAHEQAHLAVGTLLTCAALLKIDCCPMTGFESEGYNKVLGLEEKGLTASIICPVGIRHPEDSSASIPKVRYDYDEIVMEL